MSKIIVLSRNEVVKYYHDYPYFMMSFHDHNMEPALLTKDTHRKDTLVLGVDDEREVHEKGFGQIEGEKVARFLLGAINNNYDIVVHCNAGVSRSQGVGLAAALLLNQETKPYFEHGNPNPLVVHHTLTAARALGATHADLPKMLRKVIVCPRHEHHPLTPSRDENGLCGICQICHIHYPMDSGDTLHIFDGSFKGFI